MTIPILPPFIPVGGTYPTVQPFTFRDGYSYVQKFDRLVKYVNTTIVPWVETNYNELAEAFATQVAIMVAAFEAAVADISDQVAQAEAAAAAAQVSADLAAMYAGETEAFQDAAITAIFNDLVSDFRTTLDATYAVKADLTEIETTVNEGRLSEATIDARFADKADITVQETVETGRLSETVIDDRFLGKQDEGTVDAQAVADVIEQPFNNVVMQEIQTLLSKRGMANATINHFTRTDPEAVQYNYSFLKVESYGYRMPGLIRHEYGANYQDTWVPGTAFKPTLEPITTLQLRKKSRIVSNAAGVATSGGDIGTISGCSIRDGVVYSEMNTTHIRHAECIGVLPDGMMKVYSAYDGDTMATILADGVTDAWGFGPILVKNGVNRPIESSANYGGTTWATDRSARTILGQTTNGSLILLHVEGETGSYGIRGNELNNLAISAGCYNAVALDGGGSTQMLVDRKWSAISSDTGGIRNIGDFICINANVSTPIDTGWRNLPLVAGTTGQVRYRYIDGKVNIQGNVTGTYEVGSEDVAGPLPEMYKPRTLGPRGAAFLTSGHVGEAHALTSGMIGLAHQSGATRTSALFSIEYPLF